jgi:hypothetical protein
MIIALMSCFEARCLRFQQGQQQHILSLEIYGAKSSPNDGKVAPDTSPYAYALIKMSSDFDDDFDFSPRDVEENV